MNRLGFLRSTVAAALAPAPGVPFYDRIDRITPINAEVENIVRITVCTRPFRAAGPRFDVERLGEKTVFHNYGHGGSGWSLSWGSAQVVLEKLFAAANGEREIAIIGCGAIGLTTAVAAQRLGLKPIIYAAEQFPFVRSARATGSYTPDSRIALTSAAPAEFPALWERMARRSFEVYQSYLGSPGTPVEWVDHYAFSNYTRDELRARDNANANGAATHDFADYDERIDDLYTGRTDVELRDGRKPYNVKFARRGTSMTFNIADYSRQLREEFYIAGGSIQTRTFATPRDLTSLTQRLVINCTGYGARKLWSDESITPVRGQIAWLPPQEGVHYGVNLDHLNVLARRDGIVVQPILHGDETGWNDDNETPDRKAAEDGVLALKAFYDSALA